jgi:hypothetical protein
MSGPPARRMTLGKFLQYKQGVDPEASFVVTPRRPMSLAHAPGSRAHAAYIVKA